MLEISIFHTVCPLVAGRNQRKIGPATQKISKFLKISALLALKTTVRVFDLDPNHIFSLYGGLNRGPFDPKADDIPMCHSASL